MELSSSRSRDHKWKIPVQTGRVFGEHVSLIRRWLVTDVAAYEGARLRGGLLDTTNTSKAVWADSAYRSAANEDFLDKHGFVSMIHRKKPKRRPMPEATRHANNAKSKVRSLVEHVCAQHKARMGLFVRTIGIARAKTKIGIANHAYNIRRLVWLNRTAGT
ncbi:transposase [Bosea sp. OAE506]|uniref:transposase n=1 Tax=Bosea sp. OAE506 TaxID=2663870 RepID=UPI001789EBA2